VQQAQGAGAVQGEGAGGVAQQRPAGAEEGAVEIEVDDG
jgi:hypothetical protein